MSGVHYRLVMVQRGDGCGHTIGCGTRVMPLGATTLDAAMTEARSIVAEFDDAGIDGHARLAHAYLVAEAGWLPLPLWRSEDAAERTRLKAMAAETQERAEFERLRTKYEGNKR